MFAAFFAFYAVFPWDKRRIDILLGVKHEIRMNSNKFYFDIRDPSIADRNLAKTISNK